MKRKIPVRKHHGIRDPIKQNIQKLEKIKDQINNPADRDQHVSYKLLQFMKLKNDVKTGNFKKFKKSVDNEDTPKKSRRMQRKIKPIKKLPNEGDQDYLKRVNRITSESLIEAQYELKHGIGVIRESKSSEIKIQGRRKSIDEISKKKDKRKSRSKSLIDSQTAKELVKQVIKEENQKKKGESREFERDIIQFGEVVRVPPVLTLPRKAQENETVARPGKRSNLLLKSFFNDTEKDSDVDLEIPNTNTLDKNANAFAVDLKGKRKNLPFATRRMIEDQQSKAIEVYRKLKNKKQ